MKAFHVVEYDIPNITNGRIRVYFTDTDDANAYIEHESTLLRQPVKEFSIVEEQLPDDVQYVWVVSGDDHDYDQMSQWHVGVYRRFIDAMAGKEADIKNYATGYTVTLKKAREKTSYEVNQHRIQ